MRYALLVLLLPALATAQENEAEKLFRQFEKSLLGAETYSVAVQVQIQHGDKEGKFKGNFHVARNNRVRMEIDGDLAGKEIKMTAVSDGTKVIVSIPNVGTKEEALPKKLSEMLTIVIARVGPAGIITRSGPGKGKEEDTAKALPMSDFKMEAGEKVNGRATKVIKYRLMPPEKDMLDITLWLDAKTLLPVKRVIAAGPAELRETYSEFKLNPKLDAKTFTLPE